jgi:pimeloyl-ACP methyl ester carboxylesterase
MLTPPHPTPERDRLSLPEGEMALLRWPKPQAPRLLFAHANGFCASAYKQMLGALSARFDIVAPDLRGHGRTTLPADPAHHKSWDIYARDLVALNAALDRPADLALGHSMGGTSWVLAAAMMETAPPLVLIDPAMLPGMGYRLFRSPLHTVLASHVPIAKQARRRTRHWPDREAALARYRGKPPFHRWADGVLEDYLEDGLTQTADGVRLSCDPEWEAANFEAHAHDLPKAGRRVASQIQLMKSQHGSVSMYASSLARRGARVETLEGTGHLAPLEDPSGMAVWITQAAETALDFS